MKARISILIITKNNQDTIEKTLESVKDFDQVVVVDSNSNDKTRDIVNKVLKTKTLKIIKKEFIDIGKQRNYGLKYCLSEWILILDSDEVVSKKLSEEIYKVLNNQKQEYSAYEIPYSNYFCGKELKYGGEDYKMVRLFKKKCLEIKPSIVHNKLILKKGKIGKLKEKIIHYSYRSLYQVYKKFTDYSFKTACVKAEKGEKSSLKKIFIYPLHMFWARYFKDKGYKDGLYRIPLDMAFAYMEFLTYLLLVFKSRR